MTDRDDNAQRALVRVTNAWRPTRQITDAALLTPAAGGTALHDLRRLGLIERRHGAAHGRRHSEWRLLERAREQDTRDLLSPRPDPDWQ